MKNHRGSIKFEGFYSFGKKKILRSRARDKEKARKVCLFWHFCVRGEKNLVSLLKPPKAMNGEMVSRVSSVSHKVYFE